MKPDTMLTWIFVAIFVGGAAAFIASIAMPGELRWQEPPRIVAADTDDIVSHERDLATQLHFAPERRLRVTEPRATFAQRVDAGRCVAVIAAVRGPRAAIDLELEAEGTDVAVTDSITGPKLVAQAQWCGPLDRAVRVDVHVQLRRVYGDRDAAHAADVVVLGATSAAVGGLTRLNRGYLSSLGVDLATRRGPAAR